VGRKEYLRKCTVYLNKTHMCACNSYVHIAILHEAQKASGSHENSRFESFDDGGCHILHEERC